MKRFVSFKHLTVIKYCIIGAQQKQSFYIMLTLDRIFWCVNALEVCRPSFIYRQKQQASVDWSRDPAVFGGDCGCCKCSSLGDCSIFLADLSAIQSSPCGLEPWRRQNTVQGHRHRLPLCLAQSQNPAASSCSFLAEEGTSELKCPTSNFSEFQSITNRRKKNNNNKMLPFVFKTADKKLK